MQLAASALAQAVSKRKGIREDRAESASSEEEEGDGEEDEGGEGDEGSGEKEGEEGIIFSSARTNPTSREDLKPTIKVRLRHKQNSGKRRSPASTTSISDQSDVTIDALVGILQEPDRGVPRARETRLKDVKIRRGRQWRGEWSASCVGKLVLGFYFASFTSP